ncbi:MAG TPA: DNA alkylation repair protein [Flavobacterium sp.]|nr:DNA alkylation repair protein [Flavobacterium sp.]
MSFVNQLETSFKEKANYINAVAMSKYMKNHFAFYGIKTTERRDTFKEIWKQNKTEVHSNARNIALQLYTKEQRELHYCAIEIVIKELKGNYKKEDIQFIEDLIIKNSWWDSVDTISKYILGQYLVEFPELIPEICTRFSNSENMWLNRSAILFQLGYKEKTNFELLKSICLQHQNSTEFFIQKAIGWSLREYAKSNPKGVIDFVANSKLKLLSKKEALKNVSQ